MKPNVLQAVNFHIERAESFLENRVSYERAMAYDYYYGKPFGNEEEGRSQVVSQDVSQVVDSAVPALVKIFVGSDKAVEFMPRGPEDVQLAELATEGCNYVFFSQNNGFALAHDFIKDGLLLKTGVFHWYWDVTEKKKRMPLQQLGEEEYFAAVAQAEQFGATIVDHEEIDGFHNLTIEETIKEGRVKVCTLPQEEVLISPDAMSLNVYEMPFIGIKPLVTASELREMGIKQSVIDTLPGYDDEITNDEEIARKSRLDAIAGFGGDEDGPDPSLKHYRLYRCWLKIDLNGDGIAELAEVWKVGETILKKEATDHIPLCIWTPKVMPHEVIGISLADDVMDIQLLKSVLWRSALDNMYLTNAPRMIVGENGQVNLDDVLTVRPGGIIRAQDVSQVQPVVIPFTAQHTFQALEYADQEEEVRTGISRLFQGIDPQSINKTATGVNALITQANARIELVARNAAEYGFKPLFQGILYLLAKHQQGPLIARVANDFVDIPADAWNKEYDLTVNVGLGTGTKEQQMMQLQQIMQIQAGIIQSPAGQMFPPDRWYQCVYKAAGKIIQNAGFKDISSYLPSPEEMQPPPPPGPPPEVQVAQMKIQAEQQTQQMKMQSDSQQAQMDAQLKAQEGEQKAMMAERQARIDAEVQLAIAQMKAQIEAATKVEIARINAMVNVQTGMQRQETDGIQE